MIDYSKRDEFIIKFDKVVKELEDSGFHDEIIHCCYIDEIKEIKNQSIYSALEYLRRELAHEWHKRVNVFNEKSDIYEKYHEYMDKFVADLHDVYKFYLDNFRNIGVYFIGPIYEYGAEISAIPNANKWKSAIKYMNSLNLEFTFRDQLNGDFAKYCRDLITETIEEGFAHDRIITDDDLKFKYFIIRSEPVEEKRKRKIGYRYNVLDALSAIRCIYTAAINHPKELLEVFAENPELN